MTDTCCGPTQRRWYQRPLCVITSIVFLLVYTASFFEATNPIWKTFLTYFSMMWWALGLGVLLGGIIDRFLPQTHIRYFLARHKKRTILYAVLLGFLMSVCSHGILAIAAELYKKKACPSSIIALLLAAPWSNMSITLLLIAFFGLKAFIIIGISICVAIVTGLCFQVLETKGLIGEHHPHGDEEAPESLLQDFKQRWSQYTLSKSQLLVDIKVIWQAMKNLFDMVGWWVVLGMLLASLAAFLVPHGFMAQYMGPSLLGLLTTLGLATVVEVCSEGTAPLAFELYQQTHAFGNVLVFLMAGVATDYTEIAVLWSVMGKRVALWMVALTVPQIVAWGYVVNLWL